MNNLNQQIPPAYYYQDDELTLKELILKGIEFWKELWYNKFWIILAAVILAAAFFYNAYSDETIYTSALSFMVSEDASTEQGKSGFSPYGELNYDQVENNKITELARSGRIIHDMLFGKISLNNKIDFIANHLIDIYDFQEKWASEPLIEENKEFHLKDFRFTHDSIDHFTNKEYRALNTIHQLVAGNNLTAKKGIMRIVFNDKTDIFEITINSRQGNLSQRLVESLFLKLKIFYIDETIGRPRKTYTLLGVQEEYALDELNKAERALISAKNRNRGLTSASSGFAMRKLEREYKEKSSEYNTILKSKKNIEILLSKGTPEFIVIDRTFFPIVEAPSKIKAIVIGGFLGGFLASVFFLGRKIVRDAMNS